MSNETSGTAPRITEMDAQRMAVIEGRGTPSKLFAELVPVLYGVVQTLAVELEKKGTAFVPGALRARYPEISSDPDDWRIILGTPVPNDLMSLAELPGGDRLRLEDWRYGAVAEALHLGDYEKADVTMSILEQFVAENGYEIVGPYEEEYLSGPEVEVPRTIIRFEVRKR